MRIEGLYFDQQGTLSNRVVEGSTVRIGVSEVGYAFPAPTGIVDYDLRHPGNGTPSATIVASAGPFQAHSVSIDGNLPLISSELQLPMGASYQISTQTPLGVANSALHIYGRECGRDAPRREAERLADPCEESSIMDADHRR